MKTTQSKAQNLLRALGELAGVLRAVPQGDGKPDLIIREPYRLTAVTRLKIAHNIRRLREISETFQEANTALLSQLSDGTMKIDADAEETPEAKAAAKERGKTYLKEINALLKAEIEVEIQPITMVELVRDDEVDKQSRKLPPNPIDPGVLATLLDIAQ